MMGTPQMASDCIFLQDLGFLTSRCSPKAVSPCHASHIPAQVSPDAHSQRGFAAFFFFWCSPSSLLGGHICPQHRKLATSETNLTSCSNICLYTYSYTSVPSDLQASIHERGQQALEHVVSLEEHFLLWFSSRRGDLQGRASSQSF